MEYYQHDTNAAATSQRVVHRIPTWSVHHLEHHVSIQGASSMNSYLANTLEDLIADGDDVRYLELPQLMPNSAIIFHYHTYNITLQELLQGLPTELSGKCHWRVVFTTQHFEGMKDVEALWEQVKDEFLPHQKLHVRLVDWHPVEAVTCTNCGTLDTTFKMVPCALCQSPLCQTCHQAQSYCNSHKN